MSNRAYAYLAALAETLDDIEHQRVIQGNRLAAQRRTHGGEMDFLTRTHQDLEKIEADLTKELVRAWHDHPLSTWTDTLPGLASGKLIARLVGCIGDPYIATPHHWEGAGATKTLIADEPYTRTVSQLWQFCGHGRAEKRRRGMTQDEAFRLGNPRAKKAVYLVSYQFMRTPSSEYRSVYLVERAYVKAERDWSDGHAHAHALRIVGKEFLRDLWWEARRLDGGAHPVAPREGGERGRQSQRRHQRDRRRQGTPA